MLKHKDINIGMQISQFIYLFMFEAASGLRKYKWGVKFSYQHKLQHFNLPIMFAHIQQLHILSLL